MADPIPDFIARWSPSGGAEHANYGLFLTELCDLLDVPHPDPKHPDGLGDYVFERDVLITEPDGSTSRGRIDLYKRGCFVLETKQGVTRDEASNPERPQPKKRGHGVRGTTGWDQSMVKARTQAERYARALLPADGWPPFLVVVDVGYSFELFADFTRSGKTYQAFPDANTHRIFLAQLTREEIRERLRFVWTDPLNLDESRRGAAVTRDISAKLAKLARSLEADSGHDPQQVAHFLMRCLFTMYAEDVGLIPENSFRDRLIEWRDNRETHLFPDYVQSLWQTMANGGFSPILKSHVRQFNGGLFEDATALPLTPTQYDGLIDASKANWKDVEPAIFGTLLERALDNKERHKLGAHFTPKAYVERLVLPTIIEPLTQEWRDAEAAALAEYNADNPDKAIEILHAFLRKLCDTKVLDPACGTGNFLYVTMEHMKRIEGEVWDRLRNLGETQSFEGFGLTVDPHQFLGIEINPRAAAIADLVLWIGYLRWHLRTFGSAPKEPILRKYDNIECRDAVLAFDRAEPLLDGSGNIVSHWDGVSTKRHPVTGKDVPDESQRVQVFNYVNPRKSDWPPVDFIVSNPPFIGNKRMRPALGQGYVEALRECWKDVPDNVDYVMYWWDHAADATARDRVTRFGFITTNSITQTFSRKVLTRALANGIGFRFAIPDHPWVDEKDGASVRVAMTAASRGSGSGRLMLARREIPSGDGLVQVVFDSFDGIINDNLTIGSNVSNSVPLQANTRVSFQGPILVGEGFRLSQTDLSSLHLDPKQLPPIVRPYLIGRDIVQVPEKRWVIDFFVSCLSWKWTLPRLG